VVLVGHHHGVGPAHRLEGLPQGLKEVASVGFLQEVGEDLGVRLRPEAVPPGLKGLLELQVVLKDAVVDEGDPPVLRGVGVGVGVRGGPVGGPAGVADAQGPLEGRLPHGLRQGGELPRALHHLEALRGPHRNAGGVVPPILQAPEPVQKHVRRVPKTYVAYDPAHMASKGHREGAEAPKGHAFFPAVFLWIRPAPRLSAPRGAGFPSGLFAGGRGGHTPGGIRGSLDLSWPKPVIPFAGSATS